MTASRESLLCHLYSLTNRGIKLGLDNMREASRRVGNPHEAYPSILVGGTNGKGSTCAYLESALRAAGCKTGLYTSPHLVRFEERFAIDGLPVGTETWLDVYRTVGPVVDELELTFFEAATLIAFELFRREQVDWAIVEVGLGGRLDATNILTPRACIITSIALDHQQYLGSTLTSIAAEKLGIVKEKVPLIIRRNGDEEVDDLVVRTCRERGAPLHLVEGHDVPERSNRPEFRFKGTDYRLSLEGKYQIGNAMLAIEALQSVGVAQDRIREGLAKAWLPGRFQQGRVGNRRVIVDVAHNPAAVRQLVTTLQTNFPGEGLVFVVGIMKDKDYGAMIPVYCEVASALVLTHPSIQRAAGIQDLAGATPQDFSGTVVKVDSVGEAVTWALERTGDAPVCITGSFHTVGEALEALGETVNWLGGTCASSQESRE